MSKERLVVMIHDVSFWAYPGFTTEGNRLIQAGMRQAERFSWEATARATLDFYGEVLTR